MLSAIREVKLKPPPNQGRNTWGGQGGHVPPIFLTGGDRVSFVPPNFWNQTKFILIFKICGKLKYNISKKIE